MLPRKAFVALAVLLALVIPAPAADYFVTLLPQTDITTALTAKVVEPVMLWTPPKHPAYVGLQGRFIYGSGGTTAKAWIQSSFDGGTTWFDVCNFAYTTATLTKVGSVHLYPSAGVTPATPTDGTLADNTCNNGLIGDRLRVKLTTTGTYAGSTSLTITAVQR